LGYSLVRDAQGELPPHLSPYTPSEMLASWPADPTAASPILVLVNDAADNPFGRYLAEILRAEGLNCFQLASASNLDSAPLAWYDLVLLAEGPLNTRQVEVLEDYVTNGGRLVAMRPDARLAPLLGLERLGGSTVEGYLQVDPSHPVGQGIATRAMQFHGTADHYRLAGGQAVAWLASADDVPSDLPAVTLHTFGQGQASMWAFDLARSVAYTRQGNPAWANQERDGGDGIRAPDMFKDWIDLDRMLIPQADQQQRLLSNLLVALNQVARPLPRLWFFPGAAESVLIATGDSHGNPAYAIEDVLTRVEKRGGHFTVYYTAFPNSQVRRAAKKGVLQASSWPLLGESLADTFPSPSAAQVSAWRARGHEFGLHPYVEEGLQPGWDRHWQEFTGLGYGPVPPTVRTHRILWTGWVETARVQAAQGIRMNLDYYHWGPGFQNSTGEWMFGHFTGSGLPMKFVDEYGRILNTYQQLTQIADDHLLDLHWGGVARVSAETALDISDTLLTRSLAGEFFAIGTNFHVDPFAVGGEWITEAIHWLEGTLDLANRYGVPIWSAKEWLSFTEVRHDARLENVQWHPESKQLGFELVAQEAPDVGLTLMLPLRHRQADLVQIQVDGSAMLWKTQEVGAVSYAWVTVDAGTHQLAAIYT